MLDRIVQAYTFCPLKSTEPQSKRFGVQETCAKLCGTVDFWIEVRLLMILLENSTVNVLQQNRKTQDS